ncbi:NAD(P)H-hydrate dehydratase [Carnobacterium divergens]|uniref:NAD(P)H-hydrate dehydratase n=1 Tax=Carnobacterium divergens TaxID=2748 RepID=UPI001071D5CF|nr:NAD(P)H-hydrate dehydratase [Carnobacterium divergens]TFJ39079.1 NAD(P)H-hydrate dehydratase [Carnobacterium divergens]TFJ43435.1 NAD(P)H-hydrate dehydratase [Carnobacterium divergens]TFJ48314.1 NAD(P)H-hydrate dehydratase [Carnobacterium divergens]TFJ50587.1 NAD(P)H-hydrate dehydratase [Carnobacterium divergens]TFJ53278.1 NAD(P)H-hydrate dehydratase [Carnobacterium divergens]
MKELNQNIVQGILPKRKNESYKGNYGHVLLIGGNQELGGAIILAASAAVYSGAGLVTVATHPSNHTALHARLPEAMVIDGYDTAKVIHHMKKATTVVIGPGLGLDDQSQLILKAVLAACTPQQRLVIDGDAITLMASENLKTPVAQTVYTPHLGEWQRLSHLTIEEQTKDLNAHFRKQLGAEVVLKKHHSEIYFEDEVWKNEAGTPAMATGGMGDTLTGMLAGFLAQFPNRKTAILAAVYLHSRISDDLAKTHYVTLPSQIIQRIPCVMKDYATKFDF